MIIESTLLAWASAFGVIAVPLSGGALKWAFNLSQRAVLAEQKSQALKEQADKLEQSAKESEHRITLVESEAHHLSDDHHKLEAKLDQISVKLDALPRLEAVLAQFTTVVQTFVPRNEMEAKLATLASQNRQHGD